MPASGHKQSCKNDVPSLEHFYSKMSDHDHDSLTYSLSSGQNITWNKTVFYRDLLCVNRCIWKPIWPKWLFLAIPLPTSTCLWYITTQLKAARQYAWFERKQFIYWHYTEKLKKEAFFFKKKNRSRNLKLLLKISIFLLEKTIMDICQILMTGCQSHPNPTPPCFQELVFLL